MNEGHDSKRKIKACTKCWAAYNAWEWRQLEPVTNPEGSAPGSESKLCAHCSELLTCDVAFVESHLRDDSNGRVVPSDSDLDRARTAVELLRALVSVADAFLGPRR